MSHAVSHRASSPLTHSDRVQLLVALCCALTDTPWGVAMSLLALVVLGARRAARRTLQHSVAVRLGGLPSAQHTGALHTPSQHREALAGP